MPKGIPIKEEWVESKAIEFLRVAEDPDTLGLIMCIAKTGFHQRQFYELKERFPVLENAFQRARTIIGARREYLALKGRINPMMVIRMAGFYDDEYRAIQDQAKQSGEDDLYEIMKKLQTKRGRMDDNQRRSADRRDKREIERIAQEEEKAKQLTMSF